jgi:hypothetical protein
MCLHILPIPLTVIELVSMSKAVMVPAASVRTLAIWSLEGAELNFASMVVMIDPWLGKKIVAHIFVLN